MLMEIRGVGLNRTSFKRRIYTSYLLAYSFLNTSVDNSNYIKSTLEDCNNFLKKLPLNIKKRNLTII